MNREQRRRQAKEQHRRPNSKKNFVYAGTKEIPIDQIKHDPNLKECDMDIVDLISKRFDWAEKGLVSNDLSKCIIMKGCDYLDALCSLRFDITPPDDRAAIRDTMYCVGNFANLFYGMMVDEGEDKTLAELIQEHTNNDDSQMVCPMVHDVYPSWNMPNRDIVDDFYACFVVDHAQKLMSFLQCTRKSEIDGDEEYVFEVLNMILKKTDELMEEAQVNSKNLL